MAGDADLNDEDIDGIDEYEADEAGDVSIDAAAGGHDRDREGVDALHDTEAEQGDETEVDDDFDLDRVAAREAGVDLDPVGDDEPRLD